MKALIILIALAVYFQPFNSYGAQYKIDPSHTKVEFKIRHLMISNVTGRFGKFSGSFDFDHKSGTLTQLIVDIEADSINTSDTKRDTHLKGEDFFSVKKFPKIAYSFTKNLKQLTAKNTKTMKGILTMKGKSKPVDLTVKYLGTVTDPWGKTRAVFEVTGKLNRKHFGVSWNKKLDSGGFVIGDEVTFTIEGEAVMEKAKTPKKAS